MSDVVVDGVIASSREAMELSMILREKGEGEMAAVLAHFAEFLGASETYVGAASDLA